LRSRLAAGTLSRVFEWIGVNDAASARAAAERVLRALPVKEDTNRKYVQKFCQWLAQNSCAGYAEMVGALEEGARRIGYSLVEWATQCQLPCTG
jgi:hypothetical protein